MTDNNLVTPLFPLTVNVLPGAFLPLQIFEPRYIDMVKKSLSNSEGFCIVLSRQDSTNQESHSASYYDIATYVEIVDFNPLDNGLLGITVQGKQKIIIEDTWKQDDQLLIGKIKRVHEDDDDPSSDPLYVDLWNMVKEIISHPEIKKLNLELNLDSAVSVGYILASVLPLRPEEKQTILEFDDPRDKLNYLKEIIKRLGG
jgi:Lon protease-like protein